MHRRVSGLLLHGQAIEFLHQAGKALSDLFATRIRPPHRPPRSGQNSLGDEHSESVGSILIEETLVTTPYAKAPRQPQVPLIIRSLNFAALGLLALILVPAFVIHPYQLFFVLPILALLMGLCWSFQENASISALYFGLSLCVVLYIFICENVVAVDNVIGTEITRNLRLGMRLQAYAKANLKRQGFHREGCCGDPLSYHYQPGTPYKLTYDCIQCTAPYETIVDSTGYLNRDHELINNPRGIDMFVAGDSTLQGYGVPSVVEFLNDLLPITIWNLSNTRYGPRQKVSALITYALPRHPKWIILEFLSENDISETITDEVCVDSGSFVCLFNSSERNRRVLAHPVFSLKVDRDQNPRGMFEDITDNSFTLSVTRFLVEYEKAAIKRWILKPSIGVEASQVQGNGTETHRFSVSDVPHPGSGDYKVLQSKRFEWVNEGMPLVFRHYDRLAVEMAKVQQPPVVILLYNPSAYEIYRDVRVDRDPETDRVSEFQRRALSNYAAKNGWMFVDLTASLSDEVARRDVWIYGNYDRGHWSPQGTRVVAPVIARELSKALRLEDRPAHPSAAESRT